jgi:acyl-coenzyme A synthetase/AMP-(fatty) acid ligase
MGLVISLDIVPSMNAPMVIGPRDRMPTVSDIREIFKHGRVNGMYSTPIFVKQLTEHDDLLAHLRSFAFVYYGGAKADRHWGDLLYQHTSVGPIFGSTETGHVHLRRLDGPDWHWYDFYDWEGVAFEEVKQGLFEMVFNRVPGQWQHAFWSHPDRDQYRTRDLWVRHPTRPTLWAYHGRADDFVMLTCGDGVDAAFLQEKLEACPAVQMAMVGGQGKDRPWLLLELKQSITREENQGWVVDLFRVLDEINETLPNITKISSKRIIIANPDKPLARTAKLALDRNKTVELYKGKIAALDMATV